MHFIGERQVSKQDMDSNKLASKLERYVERVYGYAVKRTYTRDEADDLSQEILFTALRELPRLREESKFEPWLWGIAANVTKRFRREQGKQRALYSYDSLSVDDFRSDAYGTEEEETEALYDALRTRIAMLSALYRDILILFYYDGLSVRQISERLQIAEGTVTWRLSEGRKKLKRSVLDMQETALRPAKLHIAITGSGEYNGTTIPFPGSYINDALSQSLLYDCRVEAKTVEELSELRGVPAYYIEDRLDNLVKREAMTLSGGKYLTAAPVETEETVAYLRNRRELFEPIVEPFMDALHALAAKVPALGIYTAGKSEDELIYLYAVLAMEHLAAKYNPVPFVQNPVRYDGYRWSYVMREPDVYHPGMGRHYSLGSRRYGHISYFLCGFYRKMMTSAQIDYCGSLLDGEPFENKEVAASAIKEGYVVRNDDGTLTVTVPAFTREQKVRFNELVDEAFAGCISAYAEAVKRFCNGYRKLFPAHVAEDVERYCNYFFVSVLAIHICPMAQEKGLLVPPPPGRACDVLLERPRSVK